jgi:hypothetical protein
MFFFWWHRAKSYDLLKRLEFLGKSVMGESTIKPPPLYYDRFVKGIDKYFVAVPDTV